MLHGPLPLPLRTPRLVVRPLTVQDAPAMTAYRSDPEVCRYVPFSPQTEDEVRDRITGTYAGRALEAEGDFLLLGVEVTATATVVGDVMLRFASAEHASGEVGYMLHPAHAGHGYGAEATHALLHLAFDVLGWHRVTARVDARNTASAALARRLGMRQEAHLVENEWFKGMWTDELGFALLAREWRDQHEGSVPSTAPGTAPGTATRWCTP